MRVRLPARQRGVSLVTVAIALAVAGLLYLGAVRAMTRSAIERAGLASGASLELVSDAVNQYRTTNLGTLTMSLTPVVPGFANAMAPTVPELKAAGYLSSAVSDTLPVGGAYNIALQREPANCVAPATQCTVWSRMHLSNPFIDTETGRPDIVRLSALLSRVREAASYSAPPDASTIVGSAGGWSIPNPDPAQRVGIVAVVSGLGGASEPWLRVQDTRDPLFQGPSVTGPNYQTPPVTIGGPCANNGSFATSAQGIAFCYQGTWKPYAGQIATGGAACSPNGVLGQASDGVSLICVAGSWRDHLTYGYQSPGYFANGTVVPKPVCGAGLTPQAIVSGVSASVITGANVPGNNTGSWQANIDQNSWVVTITGSDGTTQAGANARALVQTLCVPI